MNKLEWIVWGAGCLALLFGLVLVRSGRVMGRAALLFSVCMAAALALTYFTSFSKLHLFWILPVALCGSGILAVWLGARMMRTGLQQAMRNPEFQDAIKQAVREQAKTPDDRHAA